MQNKYYIGIDPGAVCTSIASFRKTGVDLNFEMFDCLRCEMPMAGSVRDDAIRFIKYQMNVFLLLTEIRKTIEIDIRSRNPVDSGVLKNFSNIASWVSIACEKPMSFMVKGRGIYVHYAYAIIQIAIDDVFPELDCRVYSPGSIKKLITGSGRASKKDIKHWMFSKYNLNFTSEHDADAFGVALFAMYEDMGLVKVRDEKKHKRARRTK